MDEKISYAGLLYNHQLYWNNLSPYGGEMESDLQKAIKSEFKSIYIFKLEFLKKALRHETNGWVWLILDDQKKLKITLNSETNHRKYHIKQYLNSHTINIYAQFFRFCQTECKEIKAYADQTDSCHQIYT